MDETEGTYEWVIRGLYAALIIGNLLYVWDCWKGTASGIAFRARMADRLEHVKNCEPCARRRQWLRDRGHMMFEATTIVEEAREDADRTDGLG